MSLIGRREFIRRAAMLILALPTTGAMAACSRGRQVAAPAASSHTFGPLPLREDLLIGPDLPIERGARLRVYQWKDYLAHRVLRSFERSLAEFDVRVEVDSFLHIDEAVARLQEPDAHYDVVFPVVDVLPGMVRAGMLRPLNHDYLTNLGNLWGWFRGDGPFYDPGQRYSVPYTVYSGGLGWRADMVRSEDGPDVRADPFAVFTDPAYRGLVGFQDAYREALALGLQRVGVPDVSTASDDELAAAASFLAEAVRTNDAVFTIDGAVEGLAEGRFAVHEAWSGDVLSGPRYAMREGEDPAKIAAALRFWSPGGASRIVGLDLMALGARGRNPVTAHAFVNHLLDLEVAVTNFAWNGYQVPMTGATPEMFADPAIRWHDCVPPPLREALVSEEEFAAGQMLVGFSPAQDARWLAQWSRVSPP